MKKLVIAGLFSSVSLFGCAADESTPPDQQPPDEIDTQLLAEYRAALPTLQKLQAPEPQNAAARDGFSTEAVGDPALFPTTSYDIVIGINGAVSGIIQTLEQVVAVQPTLFNSETKEFFWGPFENEDGIGYVAAYIREGREGADFQYEYALLRGVDNDVSKLTPVIWGGATPDPTNEDYGVGVTLWDFEANRAFEEANNPDYPNLPLDQGRFVALYAAGPDEEKPEAEVTFVLAAFRNFVSKDDPQAEPANLDYFYGRFVDGDLTVDFIDWEAGIDVSEPTDELVEDVGVRMAFINEGAGRAEADARNGSLAANEEVRLVECWDAAVAETYLSIESVVDGTSNGRIETGNVADCGLFSSSLSELGVPSLDDVDAELRNQLAEVAENGVPAE